MGFDGDLTINNRDLLGFNGYLIVNGLVLLGNLNRKAMILAMTLIGLSSFNFPIIRFCENCLIPQVTMDFNANMDLISIDFGVPTF